MATNVTTLVFKSLHNRVSGDEWDTRVNLAACYRLVALYGWSHLTLNHISARVPGKDDHFLLNPNGLMFKEVTASSLVKIDLNGNILDDTPYEVNKAGFTIHSAIHAARPDVTCVLHTHTEAGMAISVLKRGLLMLEQGALRFYNRIGYHAYEGIALDLDERKRLVKSLGPHFALILRNHGLLTCGREICEAFNLMYHLEKACKAQLMALSTGEELEWPSPEISEHTAQQAWRNDRVHGARDWPALLREADAADPSYRD